MSADVPRHVQKVRNMTSDQLQSECNKILKLGTIEPVRELPHDFRSTDNDPLD